MTMAIAFANLDMRAVNVISVKRDSQAANVMNVNRISLVTSVMNANQLISIIHCVKVSLSKFLFSYKNQSLFSISECICNLNGSTPLDCHEDNGKCSCKDGYTGDPDSREGCYEHIGLPDRVTIRPRDGCVQKNETYLVGTEWNDGCEFTCICSEKLEILCQVYI